MITSKRGQKVWMNSATKETTAEDRIKALLQREAFDKARSDEALAEVIQRALDMETYFQTHSFEDYMKEREWLR